MKSKYWLYAFLAVPLIVAFAQIYIHVTSDLVSWRGGGFGMYSDPHISGSRYAWIVGVNNNDTLAIRISPIDNRLTTQNCGESGFYYDSMSFDDIAWDYLDFPSGKSLKPLKDYYNYYIEKYKDETLVQQCFPTESLRFVVMQQAIAPGFKNIESKELTNLPLE